MEVWWVRLGEPPRRKRRRAAPAPVPGPVRNLSLTGAAIVGPPSDTVVPGSTATIELANCQCEVIVRRIEQLQLGVLYGVEFQQPSRSFIDRVDRILTANQR